MNQILAAIIAVSKIAEIFSSLVGWFKDAFGDEYQDVLFDMGKAFSKLRGKTDPKVASEVARDIQKILERGKLKQK